MSTADQSRPKRRPGVGQPAEHRPAAQQPRAPLIPLEPDDLSVTARREPPAPLGSLLNDVGASLPSFAETRPARDGWPQGGAPARPGERTAATGERPVVLRQRSARDAAALRVAPQEPVASVASEPLRVARDRLADVEADLQFAEYQWISERLGTWIDRVAAPAAGGVRWWLIGVVATLSLLVLFALGRGGDDPTWSGWLGPVFGGNEATRASRNALFAAARPVGDYNLQGPPSLTPDQIERILMAYGSPAVGTGHDWYNLGLKYGIDPAFAVAFFIHESGAGTNPNWAGLKPGGQTTHNVGNIICAGYPSCYGRFRDYASWAEGIEDWYRLIDVEYIQGRGTRTVAEIIPIYAPSFENDVAGYVNVVQRLVDEWRSGGVR